VKDLKYLSDKELADELNERANTVEAMGEDQRWRAHQVRTVPLLREAAQRMIARATIR
jgi:hypothetical protein